MSPTKRRFILLVLVLSLATPTVAEDAVRGVDPSGDDSMFGTTRIWSVHLVVSRDEFAAMQPPVAGFGAPRGARPAPPNAGRDRVRNLFGTEFPWATARVSIGEETFEDVGLRYDGEITYLASARRLKRPLRIRFDSRGFRGLTSLRLHSMTMDPARGREALAFSVLRAAGVPAPRTAFAKVTLTVPGRFDEEYLGLYTVVEGIDEPFLANRFGSGKGALMRPFRVRSVEYFGNDWTRYAGAYRPVSEPTRQQSRRIMAFASLVHQADDERFAAEIDSFVDIDSFLRFLAANALVSNLESSFALGHNYHLYLDPETDKFAFLPGDLEFSFGNFLPMGTADQLADLSLVHPYPGENQLVERLLTLEGMKGTYEKLLREISENVFTKDGILAEIEAIERTTKEPLDREARATAARREPPAGFGPPGGPQPHDLRTFVDRRIASISRQLAGEVNGYVPAGVNFGNPGGGRGPSRRTPNGPIDEATFAEEVEVPDGFEATLFAAPPDVSYPVAIAAAPGGVLFVAVDRQGSVGTTPGGGRILRCVDENGDGRADSVTEFARVEHPRGLVHRDGRLWVLHAKTLSLFRDDGTGTAVSSEVLVTGLTSDMIDERGGDHATNGIRMGIDGWIYIAVGDYGCPNARGKDGSRATMRGGILRVRPDGTELEVFATGLRNPFDIGIDPFMNLFTRDNNDNRAGGWDIRVLHLVQGAYYGYSQHYANFPEEIMPPLGQFGGGSGVGTLCLQDERWPERYRNVLLTGDWGRSEVYRHELKPHGPTFDLRQEVFLKFPRPTGIAMDENGRLYVASFRGGEASRFVGPNVGFVASVAPSGLKAEKSPSPRTLTPAELVRGLGRANAVARLRCQDEILRRGPEDAVSKALTALAADANERLEGRAAAIFTLKQLDGRDAHEPLLKLAARDSAVREFVLRAVTDRLAELEGLPTGPFVEALSDDSPRVRTQAIIAMGRLGDASVAERLLPLTSRPKGSTMPTGGNVHAQPDPDRVLPHLAVRTLVSLAAIDACLAALDGPHADGALWALRSMHDEQTVDGLISRLRSTRSAKLRRGLLTTLIRLYHREAEYTGVWWGIRPENTGPYYDAETWGESDRIASVLVTAVREADAEFAGFLRRELARHRVKLEGIPVEPRRRPMVDDGEPRVVVRASDPTDPDQIGNLPYETVVRRALRATGDPREGERLFTAQSCIACHTVADGGAPKGPHLVGIGKRYTAPQLLESILKPSAKIAQGFETQVFVMADGRTHVGFVVGQSARTTTIRDAAGRPRILNVGDIEEKVVQRQSNMPERLVGNLTPDELAHLLAYLRSLGEENGRPTSETPPAVRN